jgi:iron-sulfur cluster assembly protein
MTIVTLSEEAREYIIAMLTRQGSPAVKLGLAPQGCNGYKYTWDVVGSNIADHVIDLDEEHSLVFDKKIVPYILDSEIVLEPTGFMAKQLTLKNPNVMGSCGCGESVNFK